MFNEKLKELRKKANITQEELAEKINVSRQTIVKWESGESEPSISIVKNIAELFGVTIEEMVGVTPKSKELSVTKKVWSIIGTIIALSFLTFVFVVIDPYVDNFFENMSDGAFIAMIIFFVVSLISLAIGSYYLKRYSIKNNDKQLYQTLLPKDFFGRPINYYNKKIRFLLYFMDVFCFLILILIIDILAGNKSIKDCILVIFIVGIPAYIIETIINERNIKKFNKMK